jgi:hypothetical protein
MHAQAILPEAWEHVLEQVETALREAEAAAAARERAATAPGEADDSALSGHRSRYLERLEARLQAWQAVMQHAEEEAKAADDTLHAAEEELRQWLSGCSLVEQRLVKWAACEVS